MKEKYERENFIKSVQNAESYRDVCRNLNLSIVGGNIRTVKKYIKKYDISTDHFLSKEEHLIRSSHCRKIPLEEILIENSKYTNNERLKSRLIKEGLLTYVCEECDNNGIWLDKELTLQLDHVNGIRTDNRLFNLRFLCPNCHSQTSTFGGKNKCDRS